MFGRKKKTVKVKIEETWRPFVQQVFVASGMDPKNHPQKEYYYAYTLGFLDEYLRRHQAKDKQIVAIADALAYEEFGYTPEERSETEKRIRRSTTSIEPLLFETSIRGQEAFMEYNQTRLKEWLGADLKNVLAQVAQGYFEEDVLIEEASETMSNAELTADEAAAASEETVEAETKAAEE